MNKILLLLITSTSISLMAMDEKEALITSKPLESVKKGVNQGACCSYSSPYANQPSFYQPQQSAIIEADDVIYTPQTSSDAQTIQHSTSEHSFNNNTSYNPATALFATIRNAFSSTTVTPADNTESPARQSCSCSIVDRLSHCISFDMCFR